MFRLNSTLNFLKAAASEREKVVVKKLIELNH